MKAYCSVSTHGSLDENVVTCSSLRVACGSDEPPSCPGMRILRTVFQPALRSFHGVSPSPTSILRSRLLQRPSSRPCHTQPPFWTGCADIKGFRALRFSDARLLSTRAVQPEADVSKLPVLAPPAVGRWLLFSSALVFAVIVVGGVTRLTESGLSITEWQPITGIIPPLNDEDWNAEFKKYKATPEFKLSVCPSSSSFVLTRLIGLTIQFHWTNSRASFTWNGVIVFWAASSVLHLYSRCPILQSGRSLLLPCPLS